MPDLCNLDGDVLPLDQARIPVLDRGFLFGDSVYEVVRTVGGIPFAWAEHLDRLQASAAAIGLVLDLPRRALMARFVATMTAAGYAESYVRIVVTRGTGSAPNIGLAYAPGPPRWVFLVRELPAMSGIHVRLAVVDRLRVDRRALDPAVKSGNYLNNVLGLAEAQAAGATDCVFLNGAGFVTEASTANVFVWRDGRLLTPPLTAGILAGVTRQLLVQFCRARGTAVEERDVTAAELRTADEVFLSSTLRDVAPVTHIDGRRVGNGEPGPLTAALLREFTAHAQRLATGRDGPQLARLLT